MNTHWQIAFLPIAVICMALLGVVMLNPEPVIEHPDDNWSEVFNRPSHDRRYLYDPEGRREAIRTQQSLRRFIPTREVRNEYEHIIRVPLVDGRCHLGYMLAAVFEELGADGSRLRHTLRVPLNVHHGGIGRLTIQRIEEATRGIMSFEVGSDAMYIRVDRVRQRREAAAVREPLVAALGNLYHGVHRSPPSAYGLRMRGHDGMTRPIHESHLAGHVVVLIHGMDDTATLWDTLVPHLHTRRYAVIEVRYNLEQSLDDIARVLANQMTDLGRYDVRMVTIITHGKGALVCRGMLRIMIEDQHLVDGDEPRQEDTRDEQRRRMSRYPMDDPDVPYRRVWPEIHRVIMLAPPHHGMELARVSLPDAAQDDLVRMLSGTGLLFGSVFDLPQTTRTNLEPGSDYLRRLQEHPLPEGVRATIVAGRASPVSPARNEAVAQQLARQHGTRGTIIAAVLQALDRVVDGVGDGVVSLDSTRLEGVDDYQIVDANHITLIRNIDSGSTQMPPGVSIILDRLSQDAPLIRLRTLPQPDMPEE